MLWTHRQEKTSSWAASHGNLAKVAQRHQNTPFTQRVEPYRSEGSTGSRCHGSQTGTDTGRSPARWSRWPERGTAGSGTHQHLEAKWRMGNQTWVVSLKKTFLNSPGERHCVRSIKLADVTLYNYVRLEKEWGGERQRRMERIEAEWECKTSNVYRVII